MLRAIGKTADAPDIQLQIPVRDASFPAPFPEGLEYSSPARGCWNIVHTGFLIPQAHQIFVCARGCLRGVVLTAAEMHALDRYSAVEIREENVLDGSMEELMIQGVGDVLSKLRYRPRAVLLFISCQHFFLAYNQQYVFETLRRRFPAIRFADCYMIPTLRKSGITPDQRMRIQLYSMLEPAKQDAKKVNLIGSNLPISASCELVSFLAQNGFTLQSLHTCKTFDDYLALSSASLNLYYEPLAQMATEDMQRRLGQDFLYLSFSFDYDELDQGYRALAERLKIPAPDHRKLREEAEAALAHARQVIGQTPIAVDYTFTFRIISFTRMLLEHGFHVTQLFADAFPAEDEADLDWIRSHFPDMLVSPTNQPQMRFACRELCEGHAAGKVLAIGQKAAYFTGTPYFVNVVESGGLFGYDGICQIASLMEEAFMQEKDTREIIQRKGYGCESCL